MILNLHKYICTTTLLGWHKSQHTFPTISPETYFRFPNEAMLEVPFRRVVDQWRVFVQTRISTVQLSVQNSRSVVTPLEMGEAS